MARKLKITVTETLEELEKRLKANTKGSSKERLLMLYWLKQGQVESRKELVKLLHRNEATITRWIRKYKEGGVTELLKVSRLPDNKALVPTDG